MHPQRFVDNSIEMFSILHVAYRERFISFHQRFQLLPQFVNLHRVHGKVVEKVSKSNSHGITARHNNQSRVPMQPLRCLHIINVWRRFQKPRSNIWHLGTSNAALVELGVAETDKAPESGANEGSDGADGDGPGDGGEEAEQGHGGVEPGDGVVVRAGLEHVERFSKGEITHDVEGVVIEPGGGVDGFAGEECEFRHEIVGVGCYAAFVISKGCRIVS